MDGRNPGRNGLITAAGGKVVLRTEDHGTKAVCGRWAWTSFKETLTKTKSRKEEKNWLVVSTPEKYLSMIQYWSLEIWLKTTSMWNHPPGPCTLSTNQIVCPLPRSNDFSCLPEASPVFESSGDQHVLIFWMKYLDVSCTIIPARAPKQSGGSKRTMY